MDKRIQELIFSAEQYELVDFKETGKQVRALSEQLKTAKNIDELKPTIALVALTFYEECQQRRQGQIAQLNESFFAFFLEVTSTYEYVQGLNEMVSLFLSKREAENNITRIALTFRELQNPFAKSLLLCFDYMLIMEGVFDEAVRIIYRLAAMRENVILSVDEIRYDTPSCLKGDLEILLGKEMITVLYDGYSSIIRNAIAHASFTFDRSTGKTSFLDLYKRGRMRLRKRQITLSYNELFTNYYQKLEDVATYLNMIIGLLFVKIIAVSENFK